MAEWEAEPGKVGLGSGSVRPLAVRECFSGSSGRPRFWSFAERLPRLLLVCVCQPLTLPCGQCPSCERVCP